ncbi:MAG: hypothetical protein M3072_05195 [Candidatus Dormibacteraeota bacterium]|nr:hypothetical protein [Candidatus Dormibacteraeota bacterium]
MASASPNRHPRCQADEGRRALFIPTHQGRGLPAAEIAALPIRSGTTLNPTYAQLSAESIADFDWLVVFDSTAYPRGAAPLSSWNAE